MIAGQIAADEMIGSSYAEDVTTVFALKQKLCSMAAPGDKPQNIYPEVCRRCGHCAYGRQLLKLIEEGRIKV